MMNSERGRIPLQVPYTEGGNLGEPYIKSTDEYVRESDVTYIVESELIRIEGHPYKKLDDHNPLVSPSRYNVVELQVPDMRKLLLPPHQGNIGLDTEIPVWKLVGFRIDVQGVLCPATTGQQCSASVPNDYGAKNPDSSDGILYNMGNCMVEDADSNAEDLAAVTATYNWGMEHKQVQFIAVGCEPLLGVYETKPIPSDASKTEVGDTSRATKLIEDGDIHEFGFGNVDYVKLNLDKTLLPVEMCYNNGPLTIPDILTMENDTVGNTMFFKWDRSAQGIRHTRNTSGITFPNNPSGGGTETWKEQQAMPQAQSVPTAGMVSSALDLFNKNYWLNKAQGPNNCVLWDNKCFFTFVDNTRGFIQMTTTRTSTADATAPTYDPTKTKAYLRHVKEFKVTALVRLCHVKLEAKLITWLLQMDSKWLKNLGFSFHHGPKEKTIAFREVYNMPEPQSGPGNEMEEENVQTIKVDCSGHAQLKLSTGSCHSLATSYHAAIGSAPKRGAPPPATKRSKAAKKQ
ncbi:MAG: L1 protein [Melanogrammus aeglefinus-associated papillomavirus 1]|nr:MAG: L1 protein [Melanogrammus aeglefinus-associated papillomavirus 1]